MSAVKPFSLGRFMVAVDKVKEKIKPATGQQLYQNTPVIYYQQSEYYA